MTTHKITEHTMDKPNYVLLNNNKPAEFFVVLFRDNSGTIRPIEQLEAVDALSEIINPLGVIKIRKK